MQNTIRVVTVNPSFETCDCCNRKEIDLRNYESKNKAVIPDGTKLVKVFIDISHNNLVETCWLCQECFNLYYTDRELFIKKMQE